MKVLLFLILYLGLIQVLMLYNEKPHGDEDLVKCMELTLRECGRRVDEILQGEIVWKSSI